MRISSLVNNILKKWISNTKVYPELWPLSFVLILAPIDKSIREKGVCVAGSLKEISTQISDRS